MDKNLKFGFFYLLICLCIYLFTSPLAKASDLSLSIDPPIIVIRAIPPTTTTNTISIQNKGDESIVLQIQFKPFSPLGENGELKYLNKSLEIIKKIQVLDNDMPIENITLEPKQRKNLILKINVPEDANISEYYFSIIFISNNLSTSRSTSSINQIGIATNVLLSIGATEIPTVILDEFSSKILYEKGPIPFTVRIKNSGSQLVQANGDITIKNVFGQTVGILSLAKTNILIDSTRAISNDIYLQSEISDPKHPVVFWKEKLLLGLYSATLKLNTSKDGFTINRTIYFFVFPTRGFLLLVTIIITGIVLKKRIKFYSNKIRI